MPNTPERVTWEKTATRPFEKYQFFQWQNLWLCSVRVPWFVTEPDWNTQRIVDQPPFSWLLDAIPFPAAFFMPKPAEESHPEDTPDWVTPATVPSLALHAGHVAWLHTVIKQRNFLLKYAPTSTERGRLYTLLKSSLEPHFLEDAQWKELQNWALRTLYFLSCFPHVLNYADDLWHIRKEKHHQFQRDTGRVFKDPRSIEGHRPSSFPYYAWQKLHGRWFNEGKKNDPDNLVYQPPDLPPKEQLFTRENGVLPVGYPLVARQDPHSLLEEVDLKALHHRVNLEILS